MRATAHRISTTAFTHRVDVRQHQLVAENELSARSTGKEPLRRLRITLAPETPTA